MCCYAGPRAFRKNRRRHILRWDRSVLGKEFSRFEQHVTRAMLLELLTSLARRIQSTPMHTPPRPAAIEM